MSFEELEVWKRSARLSANLYRETSSLRDFGFGDQVTRSALSVASNLAEGYERNSDREIARFLSIAKASAGELRTQLYVGIEAGYINKDCGMSWVDETKQLARILGTLIKKHRCAASNSNNK